MLNIGIIGKTEYLESYVKRIQKKQGVHVIGKTSVGTDASLKSFHFSIPEFNRIELIERSDILLMDNSSLIPFEMICDILKKGKHIFTVDYLSLTIEQCTKLVKLANESGSVVQVSNPYYFAPEIQWLSKHLVTPTFLDISYFKPEIKESELFSLLLMLLDLTGISAKKVSAVNFKSKKTVHKFNHIRLEYNDASVVNLNFGSLSKLKKFKIKAYSPEQFVKFNFESNNYTINGVPIKLETLSNENEFSSFINSIENRLNVVSGIEDYLIALSIVQKINKKLMQFSVG